MPVPAKFGADTKIEPLDSAVPQKFGADVPVESESTPPAAAPAREEPSLLGQVKGFLDRSTQPIPDTPLEGNWWEKLNAAAYNVEKLPVNLINRTGRVLAGIPGFLGDEFAGIKSGDANAALDGIDPGMMIQNEFKGMKEDTRTIGPVAALANVGGDAAATYLTGKGTEAGAKAVGPITRGLMDKVAKAQEGIRQGTQSLIGAGDRAVKTEVAKQAVSAGEKAKSTEENNRAALSAHDQALKDAGQKDVNAHVQHLADKADAEHSNAAAKSAVDSRAALEQSANEKAGERKTKIAAAEKSAKADLDKRYEGQRELLGDEQIPDSYVNGAIDKNGLSSLNVGERAIDAYQAYITNPDPALPKELKEIQNRAGEKLGWRELQGIRSKLTKQLSGGKLNGEVYQGYKAALGVVDDGLQKIADNMGVGDEVRKNRADYAHFMQTFHDPISEPNTVAKKTQTSTSPDFVRSDEETSRRSMLDKYDPEIGEIGAEIDSIGSRLSSLPSEGTRPTAKVPQYPEATQVAPPKTNPIQVPEVNTREVRAHLLDRWTSGESQLSKFQVRSLIGGGLGAVIGGLFEGKIGAGVGGMVGSAFGPAAIAKIVERPAVQEWLTRPPVGELETLQKLPYADRIQLTDGLKKVVKKAQSNGIQIDPRVAALVGAGAASPEGPQTKRLRELAGTAQ